MKLIRCHIENFGVLSDFDFVFDDGLTTVCQGNGFGKSTFAAFIKAMFYGFPRTGARNIVENERKRYDPWQGGKYGGYLEFEIQDTSYRVTRYFGKTAAKDTFSLLDLTSRRPSEAYSEKLGEELFRLDADSFARSTYVPQLSASDVGATTSIRTKLSDLVEDTNDLSNYDTAEKKLRDYRTKFRAYRGNGGIINEVRDKYLTLENQKDQAEQKKPRLQDIVEKIEQLKGERIDQAETVSDLREKIRRASHQKARQITQKRFSELRTDITKNQQYLDKMDERYPAGYPTFEEIKVQRENLSVIQQETQRLRVLKFNNTDQEIVDREQRWFADNDKVVSDIDHCDQDCKKIMFSQCKIEEKTIMQKILIVEDDTNINNLLQEALSKAGYSCEQAFSGTEAKLLLNMQEHSYALVLLDLMLPGITGEAVLEEIRKKGNLPVIVLTAKDSLDEKVKVLTSGADDYITKPFEIREVLARIQVQLRHTEEKEIKESNLSFREMVLNKATFQVSIGGKILPKITRQEFAILELLLRNPKQVFSKEDIFEYAWDEPYMGETKTLDVHISNIRKKIKTVTSEEYIETVWGIGYRLHL